MKMICFSVLWLGLCLNVHACRAKRIIHWNFAPTVWDKINYETGNIKVPGDTAFLMVSNRHFTRGNRQFADEQTDTSQSHILYVCIKNDSTYVYEIPSLKEGIVLFPKKNWVLYTEGMGKTFTGNMDRAKLMTTTYDVNVILFDYASTNNQLSGPKNYNFSLNNATISFRQYCGFLKEIQRLRFESHLFDQVNISIFLHSMGNLMFRKMMIEKLASEFKHKKFIDNLILNAACVNRKNHHQWLAQADFVKNIYIHFNKADYRLQGAMLISGNRKLGSKPINPFAANAHYVDFHEAVGKNHSYFLNIPGREFVMSTAIKSYYHDILNGIAVPTESVFAPGPVTGNKMKH